MSTWYSLNEQIQFLKLTNTNLHRNKYNYSNEQIQTFKLTNTNLQINKYKYSKEQMQLSKMPQSGISDRRRVQNVN